MVKENKVIQPNERTFKRMVYLAEEILPSAGFKPVEIYGYSRRSDWKYVTVNYEMEGPLIGLGCGAMGFTGGFEYQNTCFVPDYIQSIFKGELPIAGSRHVSLKERALRYTVCRLFVCGYLSLGEFKHKFGKSFEELIGGSGFGIFITLLKLMKVIKHEVRGIELTRKGLFTAHKICWAFVLNVPCRICEEFLKVPWPHEVYIP